MQNKPVPKDSKSSYLARHLTAIIIIKIILLILIWLFFVRDNKVKVDIEKMSEHLVASSTTSQNSAGVSP
jgi:succinate dehydrogenase hydrophobic anchor subunit